jgi:uncharacterized membrane protein (DUF2068 family)
VSAPPADHSTKQKPRGTKLLRVIGVFKLFKGVALTAAGLSLLKLIHVDIVDLAQRWANRLHIAPGNRYLQDFLDKLLSVSKKNLVVAAVALFVYSAMFLTEGIGLCLLKPWAEWMTVITTIGLIPLEVYEMFHRHEEGKGVSLPAITLLVNVVIAIYLVIHVWRRTHQHDAATSS